MRAYFISLTILMFLCTLTLKVRIDNAVSELTRTKVTYIPTPYELEVMLAEVGYELKVDGVIDDVTIECLYDYNK